MEEDWNDPPDMVEEWVGDHDWRRSSRSQGSPAVRTRLFSKVELNYSFLEEREIILVVRRALRIVPFFYYTLLLRVHSADLAEFARIDLEANETLPSDEDPQNFENGTVLSLTVDEFTPAPLLLKDTASNAGAFLHIYLSIEQPGTPGPLYAELSADLLCRPR